MKAALERARALGRARNSDRVEQGIRAARQQGKGIKKIATELGVGVRGLAISGTLLYSIDPQTPSRISLHGREKPRLAFLQQAIVP